MCHNLHIACCMNCLCRSGSLGFKIFPQPILDSLTVSNKLPVFIWAFIRYLLFPSLLLFDYSKLCPAEKTLTHQIPKGRILQHVVSWLSIDRKNLCSHPSSKNFPECVLLFQAVPKQDWWKVMSGVI